MQFRFNCPTCKKFTENKSIDEWIHANVATCVQGHSSSIQFSELLQAKGLWDECPQCHAFDVYAQKDVPKKLFLILLVIGLLIAFVLLSINFWWGFSALIFLTILDLFLYKLLPNVLVCYVCNSECRGYSNEQGALPFDHHIAEKYRKSPK